MNIGHNYIGEAGGIAIFEKLHYIPKLQILDLSN